MDNLFVKSKIKTHHLLIWSLQTPKKLTKSHTIVTSDLGCPNSQMSMGKMAKPPAIMPSFLVWKTSADFCGVKDPWGSFYPCRFNLGVAEDTWKTILNILFENHGLDGKITKNGEFPKKRPFVMGGRGGHHHPPPPLPILAFPWPPPPPSLLSLHHHYHHHPPPHPP